MLDLEEEINNIMKFKNILKEAISQLYTESSGVDKDGNLNDFEFSIFDEIPEDILKLIKTHYFTYFGNNFDWNSKADEFGDNHAEFTKWLRKNEEDDFIKNYDKIVSAVRSDYILKRRENMANRKLKAFEELILPVFGNHITGPALTKFEELALLYLHSVEDIEAAFKDAKNVIDDEGEIDSSKLEMSHIFKGGEINIPTFERFVEANPEYQKTYEIWTELHKQYLDLLLHETKAFRVIGLKDLKKLYNFLLAFKKDVK